MPSSMKSFIPWPSKRKDREVIMRAIKVTAESIDALINEEFYSLAK